MIRRYCFLTCFWLAGFVGAAVNPFGAPTEAVVLFGALALVNAAAFAILWDRAAHAGTDRQSY